MLDYKKIATYLDVVGTNAQSVEKREARRLIDIDEDRVQKYIASSAKFGCSFSTLPNRLGLSHAIFKDKLNEKPFWFWSHISGVQKYIEDLEYKYSKFLMSEDEDDIKILAKKFDHWKRMISTSTADMNALINKYEKELVDNSFLDETSNLMKGI